ncbi:hypothetical protein K456DRAFT_259400 [Colletotrichum gloeosporioides 23]|nr:hypothetical protein K456DRAFT_259400 [Colletotrichum gloeosporioides 23]
MIGVSGIVGTAAALLVHAWLKQPMSQRERRLCLQALAKPQYRKVPCCTINHDDDAQVPQANTPPRRPLSRCYSWSWRVAFLPPPSQSWRQCISAVWAQATTAPAHLSVSFSPIFRLVLSTGSHEPPLSPAHRQNHTTSQTRLSSPSPNHPLMPQASISQPVENPVSGAMKPVDITDCGLESASAPHVDTFSQCFLLEPGRRAKLL